MQFSSQWGSYSHRVINIIAEICENETIKDNLDIDLIENEILDSLAFITLISRLEEEFDIEIQPTQVSIISIMSRCSDFHTVDQ